MIVVAVTETEYRKAESVFMAAAERGVRCEPVPADEAGLAAAIAKLGTRYAIVGVAPYTSALYAALPKGGVIARFGVGHDSIDKPKATAAGVIVTNTPGALDDSVAEMTIGLLLSAARHIPPAAARTRAGEWQTAVGVELRGARLAIIGCGGIGNRVARIASRGLGMRVIGHGRRARELGPLRDEFGYEAYTNDYRAAVADADFVSLHMPATPENHRWMNGERLASLSAGAWLINTARGAVVDEAALYEALRGGRIGGAALDVFQQEPYVPVSAGQDLRTLANVIVTPHIGSSTRQACERMAHAAIENVLAAAAGTYAAMNVVNTDVLKGM